MLVSIPHYGMEPIPGVQPADYADPAYVRFPWGYADTFAANVYGNADEFGVYVLATPYSRLFVDVNRRRDDFNCTDGVVTSERGVFRTHIINEQPIFSQPLLSNAAEQRLSRYYDPYHQKLQALIQEIRAFHPHVLLLDAHTGSPNRMGEHEIIIGTRRGATADPVLIELIKTSIKESGFSVEQDVPGYAGGYIVRRYGEPQKTHVHAIQIEINAGLLMTTPRRELIARMMRGEPPELNEVNIQRARSCLEAIVVSLAGVLAGLNGEA